ncbi:GGDEF domain-containing protein, partial [Vibrio cincinnatiensis]|uniref:GGDEF domain-containing protein n=1 Tax=Vibrio cincinnatiensis TaxID=675 RepID=UPI001FAAD6AC
LCCVKEQSTSSVIPQAVTCPLMPYRLVDSWNHRRILFWILAPILREFTITQQGLQKDVYIDPLTQLQNRRWLDGKLEQLLEQERSFAFLIVDIDHFKSINDELSHLVGDKAISNVANEISSYFIPYGASCVRYGGEEFLVIMEDISLMQLKVHAESFRKRIANFPWMDILGDRSLTVSIGITLHRRGETTQRTFHRADKALYRAKANGRNQVCSESI